MKQDLSVLLWKYDALMFAIATVGVEGTTTEFPGPVREHIKALYAMADQLSQELRSALRKQ